MDKKGAWRKVKGMKLNRLESWKAMKLGGLKAGKLGGRDAGSWEDVMAVVVLGKLDMLLIDNSLWDFVRENLSKIGRGVEIRIQ